MNFPLAVVKEVKQVAENSDKEDFIIGYRITPEEIHGENVGYRLGDAQQLIDRIVDFKIDYVHVSLFTKYDAESVGTNMPIGKTIKETVGDRAAVMIIAGIFSADDALDALNHGDLVAIGRSALIDPEFTLKIKEDRSDEIVLSIKKDRVDSLALPAGLIEWYTSEGVMLPPLPGIEYLEELKK
ncbi:putative oxidoreductase [Jeotgalibaca dankookensis]|uniref:Putative oxidoreductase n=1 Tax=Jeotgalibaca dankookensis TaxID=708126 RepID=A0A1S6IPV6_9LACT|nr:hypothetical protein [Jeotgalibaca dankookensis]AQS53584.1 putative oxidoreductase [Jeotgalibaca dankookensis]